MTRKSSENVFYNGPVGIHPRGTPSSDFQQVIGFLISTGAVVIESDRQGYAPDADIVLVKDRDSYPNEREFLCAVAHELGHWAGIESRAGGYPGREALEDPEKGRLAHLQEELIAESVGLMLMKLLRVVDDDVEENAANYCSMLVQEMRDDHGVGVPEEGSAEMQEWLRNNFADPISDRINFLFEVANKGRQNILAKVSVSAQAHHYDPFRPPTRGRKEAKPN